eukprot:scaffold1605_cov63-Phaeocystis_antarctica.AAC.5
MPREQFAGELCATLERTAYVIVGGPRGCGKSTGVIDSLSNVTAVLRVKMGVDIKALASIAEELGIPSSFELTERRLTNILRKTAALMKERDATTPDWWRPTIIAELNRNEVIGKYDGHVTLLKEIGADETLANVILVLSDAGAPALRALHRAICSRTLSGNNLGAPETQGATASRNCKRRRTRLWAAQTQAATASRNCKRSRKPFGRPRRKPQLQAAIAHEDEHAFGRPRRKPQPQAVIAHEDESPLGGPDASRNCKPQLHTMSKALWAAQMQAATASRNCKRCQKPFGRPRCKPQPQA